MYASVLAIRDVSTPTHAHNRTYTLLIHDPASWQASAYAQCAYTNHVEEDTA